MVRAKGIRFGLKTLILREMAVREASTKTITECCIIESRKLRSKRGN